MNVLITHPWFNLWLTFRAGREQQEFLQPFIVLPTPLGGFVGVKLTSCALLLVVTTTKPNYYLIDQCQNEANLNQHDGERCWTVRWTHHLKQGHSARVLSSDWKWLEFQGPFARFQTQRCRWPSCHRSDPPLPICSWIMGIRLAASHPSYT